MNLHATGAGGLRVPHSYPPAPYIYLLTVPASYFGSVVRSYHRAPLGPERTFYTPLTHTKVPPNGLTLESRP